MIVIATAGDIFNLVLVAIIFTIIRRTRKLGLILLIAIVIIAMVIMYIKPFIGRQAPTSSFEPAIILPKHFTLESDSLTPFARGFSYPSNHVAAATAFAYIVGYAIDKKMQHAGLYFFLVFTASIAATRMYVMQHFLTDVIGGFIFGLLVAIILSNIMRLDQPFLMSRFKGKDKDRDSGKDHENNNNNSNLSSPFNH